MDYFPLGTRVTSARALGGSSLDKRQNRNGSNPEKGTENSNLCSVMKGALKRN